MPNAEDILESRAPAFEMHNLETGESLKIYVDGRTEGPRVGSVTLNRLAALADYCRGKALAES